MADHETKTKDSAFKEDRFRPPEMPPELLRRWAERCAQSSKIKPKIKPKMGPQETKHETSIQQGPEGGVREVDHGAAESCAHGGTEEDTNAGIPAPAPVVNTGEPKASQENFYLPGHVPSQDSTNLPGGGATTSWLKLTPSTPQRDNAPSEAAGAFARDRPGPVVIAPIALVGPDGAGTPISDLDLDDERPVGRDREARNDSPISPLDLNDTSRKTESLEETGLRKDAHSSQHGTVGKCRRKTGENEEFEYWGVVNTMQGAMNNDVDMGKVPKGNDPAKSHAVHTPIPTRITAVMGTTDTSSQEKAAGLASKITWAKAFAIATKDIGEPVIQAGNLGLPHQAEQGSEDMHEPHASWCLLPRARLGPGSDPATADYHELAKPRLNQEVEAPKQWSVSSTEFIPDEGYECVDPEVNWATKRIGTQPFLAQWDAYMATPTVWPQVIDKELSLMSPNRAPAFEHNPRLFPEIVFNPEGYDQGDSHNWKADWAFTPMCTMDRNRNRLRFYKWLEKIPLECQAVDIFHSAFFDGTAVPDGGFSLMLMNEKHLLSPRDMSDDKTRIHWHETSAGYAHNMKIHWAKVRAARDSLRSQIASAPAGPLNLAPLMSQLEVEPEAEPSSEPTNPHLRPAIPEDAQEIANILNWYAVNSPLSPDTETQEERQIKALIKICRKRNLPFLVMVHPARPSLELPGTPQAKICGIAYIDLFGSSGADQYIGELRVYVTREEKRDNFGTVLIDRILSMCDQGYSRKFEVEWKPKRAEDLWETPMLRMTQLICTIAYPAKLDMKYGWIKKWLQDQFGFEQWGMLKRARVKCGHQFVMMILFGVILDLLTYLCRLDVHYVARRITSGRIFREIGMFEDDS
ncbi:uncharacterized protein N7482_006065 [Penicillium canariense]|uniref:N-acetyltransferase domain-containing protein n=1 Tax=Penicillium canariense TaxID=189055 RepID=A0A9W9I5Z3_9EURO|nr:uncharacterized protein N7482_006065 [Penicillium canariense]KAJ5167284.1 hypothetical protein N7482_006065 [Penicillium canariense]